VKRRRERRRRRFSGQPHLDVFANDQV